MTSPASPDKLPSSSAPGLGGRPVQARPEVTASGGSQKRQQENARASATEAFGSPRHAEQMRQERAQQGAGSGGGRPQRDPRAAAAGAAERKRGLADKVKKAGALAGGGDGAKALGGEGSGKDALKKLRDRERQRRAAADKAGKNDSRRNKNGKEPNEKLEKAAKLANKATEKGTSAGLQSVGVPKPAADALGKVAGKGVEILVKKAPVVIASTLTVVLLLMLGTMMLDPNQFGDTSPQPPAQDISAKMPGGTAGAWNQALTQAQESTRDRGIYMVPWTVLAGIAKVNTDFGRTSPYQASSDTATPGAAPVPTGAPIVPGAQPTSSAKPILPGTGQTLAPVVPGAAGSNGNGAAAEHLTGLAPGVQAAGGCAVPGLNPPIGGGQNQAAGAFLVLPNVAHDMSDDGKDPQDVCDSATWVAQKLSDTAVKVDREANVPHMSTDDRDAMAAFWKQVVSEAHLTSDSTGQVGDCRMPADNDSVPVDYEISWVWRCQLSNAATLHMVSDAAMGSDGKVKFTEMGRDDAVSTAVSEALQVAYGFSKFTTDHCDNSAAVAGVFPLDAKTAKTYGDDDRCDVHANILAAAQAFVAVESQPVVARKLSISGPYAAMLGGWSAMPTALGGDGQVLAQKGPYHAWQPSNDCQNLLNAYTAKLETYAPTPGAGNPFATFSGGDVPQQLPQPVVDALTSAGTSPLTATACAGASDDLTSFYGAAASTAGTVDAAKALPGPTTAPTVDDATRTGVGAYFSSLASQHPYAAAATANHTSVTRLSPVPLTPVMVSTSDYTPPVGVEAGNDQVVAWAKYFGGFGFGTVEPAGPAPDDVSSAVGADGGTLKPGSMPAQYATLLQSAQTSNCPALPIGIFAAQIQQESGWNPRAVSPVGAEGIAQFMPTTWAGRGVDGDGDGVKDIWNPADALPAAAKFDCDLMKTVAKVPGEDRVGLMLAAYNAGPYAVIKFNGVPPFTETQNYVRNIEAAAAKFTDYPATPGTVGADGCPSSSPANTLRRGADQLGLAKICADSVAQAATPQAAAAIKWGLAHLGFQYSQPLRMTPDHFDCSSFVSRSYQGAGVNFVKGWAPTTWALAAAPYAEHIPLSQARPGDLIEPTDGHVVMLLADGYMAHYNTDGDVGHVTKLYFSTAYVALRVHPELVH